MFEIEAAGVSRRDRTQTNTRNMSDFIERQQIKWFGHLTGMAPDQQLLIARHEKVLDIKPEEKMADRKHQEHTKQTRMRRSKSTHLTLEIVATHSPMLNDMCG